MQVKYSPIPSGLLIVISLTLTGRFVIQNSRINQRGEGLVVIKNAPPEALILLDGFRKPPTIPMFWRGNMI
jgi:hypothetical protein